MRCFVAIELPENVRKEIQRTSDKLKSSKFVSGTFVNKKNMHLTLKFIGELSEDEIKKVKDSLSEIILGKFNCTTGKTGAFPSEDFVKVMWIELLGDGIMHLKGLVDNKLNSTGIKADERDFNSHITFVRVRKVKDKEKFKEIIPQLGIKKMIFPVEKFSLIKSELTREGPIYRTIEEFKLF